MGDFGEDSEDSDGEGGLGNVNRIIMRPPGHSGKAKRGHLCFDASFETGNLGRVDLINEFEYDLFIRPDTCCPKLRFWFNFTVDNVRQDQRAIFNIVNISKGRNLFNTCMTPIVKSSTRPKWQRIPKRNVFYHRSNVHKNNYVLSFAFSFDREDEVFQFALAAPYSYTRLQGFLTTLEKKASYLEKDFERELLGNSIQTRRLDMITIGGPPLKKPNDKRRLVLIMARVHPGESPASFVCQGLLELLISAHPVAILLRQYVTFKIIPMLNPDGVFLGNYRSTLIGSDLNRAWQYASPFAHPTLRAVIDFLTQINKSKDYQLDFIIDLHANSSLLGSFIYGNTYDDVYRYERHIVFPKIMANSADDYAVNNSMCNADGSKSGTARRYLCALLGSKVNSYSFEVSFYGYKLKGSDVIIPYTEESYMRSGRNLLRTFLEYYQLTGTIPINISTELQPKKQRPKTHYSRSPTKKAARCRPSTTRPKALLHFKDLYINYDSETSVDEYPFTFRSRFSPRKCIDKHEDTDRYSKPKFTLKERGSPPPQTFITIPVPSLSIIDFNIITRDDFEKVNIKSKEKGHTFR